MTWRNTTSVTASIGANTKKGLGRSFQKFVIVSLSHKIRFSSLATVVVNNEERQKIVLSASLALVALTLAYVADSFFGANPKAADTVFDSAARAAIAATATASVTVTT